MPMGPKFPVNLAAGALVMVLGGIMMRLMDIPPDRYFGLRLLGFFIVGAVSAYLARTYNKM